MEKILVIGGSPRKGGNSDILMKYFAKGAREEGIATKEIQLRDYQFQPCIGCERCRKDKQCTGLRDGMQLIYPKIRETCGMMLISPIYSYNVTAIMKAFIDRLYSFYNFSDERPGYWSSQLEGQGRKAIIAAIGEQATHDDGGMDSTLDTMRRSVIALGYEIIDELPVLGVFAKGKIKELPQILEKAEVLGKKLACLLPT
jgi:multimeric flavodoxin WrbA